MSKYLIGQDVLSFKSNQITFSYSVFHADSEYNLFKKFNKINVLEI